MIFYHLGWLNINLVKFYEKRRVSLACLNGSWCVFVNILLLVGENVILT